LKRAPLQRFPLRGVIFVTLFAALRCQGSSIIAQLGFQRSELSVFFTHRRHALTCLY
jgi:hypothetical protein